MQIVIDIPEEVRVAIDRMGLLRIPDEMQKKVDKAIQHGTPLEQIKANYDIKESEWRELGIDETVIGWMPLPKPMSQKKARYKE